MPLPLCRRVGQVLIGSFTGRMVPVELTALAREFDLGGATLFARNVESPEQVLEVAMAIEALGTTAPAWVSVDQEGGRVARLKTPFTVWPPAATLGRATAPDLADRFARALARELRAVGITLDFAPVLDVLTNRSNPAIGDRSLSDDATRAAALGAAIISAMQGEGVAACGKHFPGHGDTSVDSHFELPIVEVSPDRLRAVEFVPFRAAIAAQVACVMTAHVVVPALDEAQPATLSQTVIRLLRDELGHPGMVVSDDLEMQAIGKRWTPAEAAVAAISAGCDSVLVCTGDVEVQASVLEALVKAVETGVIPLARLDDAVARVARQKARFLDGPRLGARQRTRALKQVVGCEAHQLVAAEMAAFA
ncbi:MAG: beta-N-acetylhexosaminidase [Acidobacteria bacterium]|nr:beta-N-acetylhexosaminidase [Acidobacteriota bacterium]